MIISSIRMQEGSLQQHGGYESASEQPCMMNEMVMLRS
jgi:hypothetical protein